MKSMAIISSVLFFVSTNLLSARTIQWNYSSNLTQLEKEIIISKIDEKCPELIQDDQYLLTLSKVKILPPVYNSDYSITRKELEISVKTNMVSEYSPNWIDVGTLEFNVSIRKSSYSGGESLYNQKFLNHNVPACNN